MNWNCDTQAQNARRAFGSAWLPFLIAAMALTLPGCQSSRDAAPRQPPALPAMTTPAALPPKPGTEPKTLPQAIAYALASDSRVLARDVDVHRAAGQTAQVSVLPSPEVRFGMGRSDETTRQWSEQRQTGSRERSTEESGGSTRTGSQGETSERSINGFPQESSQMTERNYETSTRTRTGQRTSQSESVSYATDYAHEVEDGFDVGLRFFPPNPWAFRADIGSADAERRHAEAELAIARQRLLFDIVESASQIAYRRRMLRIARVFADECNRERKDFEDLAREGMTSHSDLIDVTLRASAAEDEVLQCKSRLDKLNLDFRLLTGLDAEAVVLDELTVGRICTPDPQPAANAPAAEEKAHALRRPDVVAGAWLVSRCQAEQKAARARKYPWLSHVEVSYAWWDGSEDVTGSSYRRSSEFSQGSTSGIEDSTGGQSQLRTSNTGELEQSSGSSADRTLSWSQESQYDTESVSGTKYGGENGNGDEWWVGIGVDIPIFEWFSPETRMRGDSVRVAESAYHAMLARAEHEIGISRATLQASRDSLKTMHNQTIAESRELGKLADAARERGASGRLDALRLRQRMTEKVTRYVETAMQTLLAEVNYCRAAGIVPDILEHAR